METVVAFCEAHESVTGWAGDVAEGVAIMLTASCPSGATLTVA
jgi:hypothetical protein